MDNPSNRKMPKVIVASGLGIVLLLSGGTYALWSANAPMDSEATITAGDLQVTASSAQKWFDVTRPANPVELLDLSSFYMVPGDKLQLDQELNAVIVGDNISGILEVLLPNSTESAAMLAQAKFTVALFDSEGNELGSVSPAANSANSLRFEVEELPQSPASGDRYSVRVTVELPAGANNATKLQAAVLEDMVLTLRQGGPVSSEAPVAPYPQANAQSDFTWQNNNNAYATITGYVGKSKDVVIPQTAVINGVEKPVERIEDRAFFNKGLTSVIMPDSITTLGSDAFWANNLTIVTLPKNLNSAYSAFRDNKLTEVIIPEGVQKIDSYMFDANPTLTTVTFPSTLTRIETNAFRGTGLKTMYFKGNAPNGLGLNIGTTGVKVYYHEGTTGWSNPFQGQSAFIW